MAVAQKDEKKKEWGAEMDYPSDEELPDFPSRHETEVDVNGVKTVTTYRTDETGAKYKCMRTVKVTKKTTRVHKSVLDRRKWAKFGQSELVELKQPGFHGPGFTNGFTQLDNADQQLEMTPKARVAEENNEAAARAFEKMNVGTFEAWRPKNRGDVAGDAAEWAAAQGITGGDKFGGGGGGGGGGGLAGLVAQQEAGGATGSGYVPPSMRNADGTRNESLAGAMPERDDSCTVRVSNLSEDVKDSDLRELFRRFGAIQRIYLAKDRETQQSRGFAFINFFQKEDAAAAIAKLDGHGYDHLILSVSWANPSAAPAQKAPGMSAEAFPTLGGPSRGGTGSALYTGAASSEARFDKFVHDPGLDRFR